MRSFFLRISLRCGVAFLAGVTVIATAVNAQASCYTYGRQLPSENITRFLNDPAKVLADNPDGGGKMISELRDLVASDPRVLQPVLTLLANANKDQKTAIGTALAYAARICVRVDQAYATQIQQAIAQTEDKELILAYSSASGELPIAAINPAGVSGFGASTGSSGGSTTFIGGTVSGFSSVTSGPTTFGPHSFTYGSTVTLSSPSRRVSP
jgi:hypothetical protein